MARLKDVSAFDVMLLPDSSEEFAEGVQYAMELLDKAPTVDAVEVVRCKDCKWWEHWKDHKPWCNHWRSGLFDVANADDFCSCGERKEKDDGRT